MQKKSTLALLLLAALFSKNCVKEPAPTFSGPGQRPVYLPEAELAAVQNLPPRPIQSSGTIFLRDSLFFLLEHKKGIHVFNLADTLTPRGMTFLSIPAISDFTVSGQRLYADSWRDLLTLDISDLLHVREVSRLRGAFRPPLFPPLFNGPFECVDEGRGAVVGWEDAVLENVKCTTAE